ncbi:MAG: tripartite tricarboxylate transporter TctB family protein [Burkholderiaceae bacterium]|nr:tripartite tricarboxylate transporter TctB family protein [Burkholderiaceae bacterium]
MKIQNRRDFNAGLMFILIGLFFGIYSLDYSLGSANRMGPGYFPLLLAIIMGVLGLIVLVMSFAPADAQEPPGPTDWRGIGLILASVLLFGLLLPYAGFLIAVVALVFLAATGSQESRTKETALLAIGLVVLGIGVFGYGLELQFPILPPLLTQ